jgi:6-phosphogluconolactonase
MKHSIHIFPTPFEMAEALAVELISRIKNAEKKDGILNIALSGGNTPGLFYSVLASHFSTAADWRLVHFFWGDERCVPPGHSDSNYGAVKKALLEKIDIPASNVHRIMGEKDPSEEAVRYSGEIKKCTLQKNRLPVFDIVLLGLGEDGHTASVFQGNTSSFLSENICEVAVHPVTGQKRITLTGKVINNAVDVIFLVTGRNKARVAGSIINKENEAVKYPASFVKPDDGHLSWYLDKEAGELIIE